MKKCSLLQMLILELVFPSLKLTKNCYIAMNISFYGKLRVVLKTGFTSLLWKHTVPERLSLQFHKIWIDGDFKNPSFSNSLSNWEKLEIQTWKKKQFFLSFSWKRKNWVVQLRENSNIKKYLCESGKNLQSLKLYS